MMLNVTSKLNGIRANEEPSKISLENIKDSFYRAGDVASDMKHGFKNGKKVGETTHILSLDKHFRWKPGFLYCVTGWPQSGKSEFIQYLAILKSFLEGKKWAVHSPENYPATEFFDSLAHTLMGMSTNPHHPNQMSLKEYEHAIDFLHEHFFYVYKEGVAHTPEFLREAYAYIHHEFNLFGTITDPWNKVAHLKGSLRDDQYLQEQLPMEQQQARELNLVRLILTHPKSPGRREKDEPLPVPDQYWLAGGQMWDNMCDMIGCAYRPNYHIDKSDNAFEWHSHKIKKQALMGLPGVVPFTFDRFKARYYDKDGFTPLEPHVVKDDKPYTHPANLPESDFEKPEEIIEKQTNDIPF